MKQKFLETEKLTFFLTNWGEGGASRPVYIDSMSTSIKEVC